MIPAVETSNAPFPYLGGKSKMLEHIYKYMPEKVNHLVDVFGGSGSVVLGYKNAGIKTYNDINLELANFFVCLRDKSDELIFKIENTPHHRYEYEQSFILAPFEIGDVETARKTFVKVSQSFGRTTVKSGWSTTFKWARMGISESTLKVLTKASKLNQVWGALKSLQIECLDYKELFKKYDRADTFFFLDPPYLKSTRDSGVKYGAEMNTPAEHLELIDAINNLESNQWILCCYDNEIYSRGLLNYTKVHLKARTNGNCERTETMYLGGYFKNLTGRQLAMFADEPIGFDTMATLKIK